MHVYIYTYIYVNSYLHRIFLSILNLYICIHLYISILACAYIFELADWTANSNSGRVIGGPGSRCDACHRRTV